MTSFEARMDDRDARELHRRELAQRSIEKLPEQAREQEQRGESQKIFAYEADKLRLVQARSGASSAGGLAGSTGLPSPAELE